MTTPDRGACFDRATQDLAGAMNRRQMLSLLFTAIAAGVAGCGSVKQQPAKSPTSATPPTPTPSSSFTGVTDTTVLGSWCPADPVTAASMDAALAALAAGQTQVSLSPGCCVAVQRTTTSGQITEQRMFVNSTAVATWTRTGTGVQIAWDYDRDNFAEHRTNVTGADGSATRQDTRYDPATQKPVSRITWTAAGADEKVVEEEPDAAGMWTLAGGFST